MRKITPELYDFIYNKLALKRGEKTRLDLEIHLLELALENVEVISEDEIVSKNFNRIFGEVKG